MPTEPSREYTSYMIWTDDENISGAPGFLGAPDRHQYGYYGHPSPNGALSWLTLKQAEIWANERNLKDFTIHRVTMYVSEKRRIG
jgi:hypothetical protein